MICNFGLRQVRRERTESEDGDGGGKGDCHERYAPFPSFTGSSHDTFSQPVTTLRLVTVPFLRPLIRPFCGKEFGLSALPGFARWSTEGQ